MSPLVLETRIDSAISKLLHSNRYSLSWSHRIGEYDQRNLVDVHGRVEANSLPDRMLKEASILIRTMDHGVFGADGIDLAEELSKHDELSIMRFQHHHDIRNFRVKGGGIDFSFHNIPFSNNGFQILGFGKEGDRLVPLFETSTRAFSNIYEHRYTAFYRERDGNISSKDHFDLNSQLIERGRQKSDHLKNFGSIFGDFDSISAFFYPEYVSDENIRECSKPVVEFEHFENGISYKSGNGVIIAPKFVLTANHILKGKNRIRYRDKTVGIDLNSNWVHKFDGYDLAVINVPNLFNAPCAKLNFKPQIGEDIFRWTYTHLNGDISLPTKLLLACGWFVMKKGKYIIADMLGGFNSSGSPTFNRSNECNGIVRGPGGLFFSDSITGREGIDGEGVCVIPFDDENVRSVLKSICNNRWN